MKKAIVTFAIGEHIKILELTAPLFKQYAKKHGYDFIIGDGNSDGRNPYWGKILLTNKMLADYDYVLWLDVDVVILNFDEDIFQEFNYNNYTNALVRLYDKYDSVNTGVWLLSKCAMPFLQDIWNKVEFIDDAWPEQSAVMSLLGWNIVPKKERLIDLKNCCSFNKPTNYFYQTQFLPNYWNDLPTLSKNPKFVHFAGYTFKNRIFCINKLLEK